MYFLMTIEHSQRMDEAGFFFALPASYTYETNNRKIIVLIFKDLHQRGHLYTIFRTLYSFNFQIMKSMLVTRQFCYYSTDGALNNCSSNYRKKNWSVTTRSKMSRVNIIMFNAVCKMFRIYYSSFRISGSYIFTKDVLRD